VALTDVSVNDRVVVHNDIEVNQRWSTVLGSEPTAVKAASAVI
jgi:hypothetical protein